LFYYEINPETDRERLADATTGGIDDKFSSLKTLEGKDK